MAVVHLLKSHDLCATLESNSRVSSNEAGVLEEYGSFPGEELVAWDEACQ
jgi:hypothetical protein